jgi:hypothetical protein
MVNLTPFPSGGDRAEMCPLMFPLRAAWEKNGLSGREALYTTPGGLPVTGVASSEAACATTAAERMAKIACARIFRGRTTVV